MRKLSVAVAVSTVIALTVFGWSALPASAAITPCQDGTTALPSGLQTDPYINANPIEDRSFDGPDSTFAVDSPTSPQDEGITIGEDVLRNRLCLGRANVKNTLDPNYQQSWRYWHDQIGGHNVQVFSKSINIGDMYLHGGEDGIKLQNCPEGNPPAGSQGCDVQQPGGTFTIKDVAIRNHHDDAIDDDDCMPGTIDNVLVEGHTFLSVQEESNSSGPCQSSGEGNINVKNSVIRTMPVNAFTPADGDDFAGGGKWFKWDENANTANDHHTLNLTNVVLVVDRKPRSGWSSLNFPGAAGEPGATTWSGSNNFILYLNTAGEPYGGPTPGTQGVPNNGTVTFLSGTDARNKFIEKRDAWLEAHGCAARNDEINPKDDPMCRVSSPK
jgi:hypothetical protein